MIALVGKTLLIVLTTFAVLATAVTIKNGPPPSGAPSHVSADSLKK